MDKQQGPALALLCDREGFVRQWLRNDLTGSVTDESSVSFVRLLPESDQKKGLGFIARLGEVDFVETELGFVTAGGIKILQVAGCRSGEDVLVLAGETSTSMKVLCAYISHRYPKLATASHTIAIACDAAPSGTDSASVYEQLMLLYNDLARLQRDYASQNVSLARLSDEKDRMMNMVAHDLRGPLNAISLLASSVTQLAGDRLTGAEKTSLDRIVDTAQDMGRSISEMLDSARHQLGVPELELELHDFRKLVRQRAEVMTAVAVAKNISIRLDLAEGLPQVAIDKVRMQHVIDNVLGNAIKYSPAAGVIDVVLEREPDSVCLKICDRGCGLQPSELERIFRPFEIGSANPTGGESSFGLGLAICHSILGAHGGSIDASNRDGGGAIFRIAVPVRR